MIETMIEAKTKPAPQPVQPAQAPPIEKPEPKVKGPIQQLLEDALEELGPNGEKWIKGKLTDGERVCTVGAVLRARRKHLSKFKP